MVLELSERDAFATTDLDLRLRGDAVDTYVQVDTDPRSPISCEQLLVIAGSRIGHNRPHLHIPANSKRMDVPRP